MMQSAIFPQFEAFYIECMLWHTNSAFDSIDKLTGWLELFTSSEEKISSEAFPSKDEVFEELQNILHQAGCLSRYVFPTDKKIVHQQRGEQIRKSLQIDEKSPIANRELRNAIEHFDEKLDKYLLDNQTGNFVHQHIDYNLPVSEVPLHIFKGFYIDSKVFVLLGTSYEMAPIINDLIKVHRLLEGCARNGLRLPRPQ